MGKILLVLLVNLAYYLAILAFWSVIGMLFNVPNGTFK